MKRRAAISILWCAAAALGIEERRWEYRMPVDVPAAGGYAAVPADRGLYERVRHWLADVRVVKDGVEVPYVLKTRQGQVTEHAIHPGVIDRGVTPDGDTRLTLDFGSRPLRHSRIVFAAAEENFRHRVRLETSVDNRIWDRVKEAYIFDFTEEGRKVSILTVDYPVSTRRFLRATVVGMAKADALTGASAVLREETPPEWEPLGRYTPERMEDAKTKTTELTFSTGVEYAPRGRIRLEASGGEFYRTVTVEGSSDRKQWRYLSGGAIFRVPGDEQTTIDCEPGLARWVRLRIHNGDSAPLAVEAVAFDGIRQVIEFPIGSAGRYWVLVGNPEARSPQFDLADVMARRAPVTPVDVRGGAWQKNPAWTPPPVPPKPFSERFPGLLPGVLAVAVLAMGVAAVRLMQKAKAS